MSIFYNAFFIRTAEPDSRLREKFHRIDTAPDSEWLVCNYGDDYPDGMFEPDSDFTRDLSQQFGEAIFICVDTRNDQLDYEHSRAGELLRKLSWIYDGCQSTWECVEGEMEEWEVTAIFSEENFARTKELLEYEVAADVWPQKEAELRALWEHRQYALHEKWPMGDATLGFAIQRYFGIKLPENLKP